MFSVYAEVKSSDHDADLVSSIKFGGWDQHATLDNGASSEITMFKTIDMKSWSLKGTQMLINNTPFVTKGETRVFDFNTHLPFLYLPDDDWLKYSELIKKQYPDLLCSQLQNVCYF